MRGVVVDPPGPGEGLDDEQASELAATTAHEARHAEEFPLDICEEAARRGLEGAPLEVSDLGLPEGDRRPRVDLLELSGPVT